MYKLPCLFSWVTLSLNFIMSNIKKIVNLIIVIVQLIFKYLKSFLFFIIVRPIKATYAFMQILIKKFFNTISFISKKIVKYRLLLIFFVLYYNFITLFKENDITCIYLRNDIIMFFENKNKEGVVWLFWYLNAITIKIIHHIIFVLPANRKYYAQLSVREKQLLKEQNKNKITSIIAELASMNFYKYVIYSVKKNENETFFLRIVTFLKVSALIWPYWLLYAFYKKIFIQIDLLKTFFIKTSYNWKPIFKKSSYQGLSKTFFLNKLNKTYDYLKKPLLTKKDEFMKYFKK